MLAVEGFKRSYMYVTVVTPFDYYIQSTEIKFTPQKGVFHKVFCSMRGRNAVTTVTATTYMTVDTAVKWSLRAFCMSKFHSIKSSVCHFNREWHMQLQENSYIWNKKSASWPSTSEEPVNRVLTFLCAVLRNQCPASCNCIFYHQQYGKF